MRSRRARWIGIGLALAVVLGFLWWMGVVPVGRHHVAMPPDDATPDQVVSAWVDAIDAHDCSTAAALWIGPDAQEDASLCHDMRSFRLLRILGEGKDGHGGYGMGTELYVHPLPFHDAATLALHGWTRPGSFELRQRPGGAWRISSFGNGG